VQHDGDLAFVVLDRGKVNAIDERVVESAENVRIGTFRVPGRPPDLGRGVPNATWRVHFRAGRRETGVDASAPSS
jgi:hypothetical protein